MRHFAKQNDWRVLFSFIIKKRCNYDKEGAMIQIRPISDLRNKFTDIEKVVSGVGPVYLTKNGYGCVKYRGVFQIGRWCRGYTG